MRSRWTAWRAPLALGVAAMLLAACGGGGGSSTPAPGVLPVVPPVSPPVTPPVAGTPTVSLTAPSPFATGIIGALALSATAVDTVDITQVEFQIDGATVGVPATAAPYTTTVDTTAYASGQHVLRVRATNSAGRTSGWATSTVLFGGSRAVPAGFTRNGTWLSGLSQSTAFAQAPDGRFFISQQQGALLVVKNGAVLLDPFVLLAVNSVGERGLLGVAVHPDFPNTPWIYLYYTTDSGGATHNRISHFTAVGDVASAGSEVVIAELPALGASNHNGGGMHFGADGKLYVGVGENAVPSNAQDLSTPLGKLLRFNADGSIPGDNPFPNNPAGPAQAVWAYGLRNPYTFAVQPGSGALYINDVGQDTWEEIDVGSAGANYGWPMSEGPDGLTSGITGPIFTYRHTDANPPGSGPGGFFTGAAITGGTFYPSTGNFPAAYQGAYFFADFASQFVARLDTANGNVAYSFASLDDSPVDMLAGIDGALYVLTRRGVTRISAP